MKKLLEEQSHSELLQTLTDTLYQMNVDWTVELKEAVDQIDLALKEYSTVKYALDQSIIVALTNESGQILYVNDKFCEISKYSREELIGKTHRIINSGYHDSSFFKNMWETIRKGEIWEGSIKNKAKDGSYYWAQTSIIPFCKENKKPYMYMALRTDITAEKVNEEKLVNALKNDFNMIVSSIHNFVFKVSKNDAGRFVYLFGEGKLAQGLGLPTSVIFHKEPGEIFSNELADLFELNYLKAYQGETVTYSFSYKGRHLLTTLSPYYENGEIVHIIGFSNDITELHTAKEEVEFLAYHDSLTNLPNRRKFLEDITDFIENRRQFAFFMFDLDRFKTINDSLGHSYGDLLLKAVTKRLREVLEHGDYFYRFAGDEFIILLPEMTEHGVVKNYAKKLLTVLKDKIQLSPSIELTVTGSIGISVYPDHGMDVDQLIKNADAAMYAAKRQGRNSFKLFDMAMKQANQEQLQIETFLQTAIENQEFELFFQPKLDIKTNRISSMEALLRWDHPILGSIPPNTFIPIAEETGIIWLIDEWVLKQACLQNKQWNESRISHPLRVAVNISPIQFSHPDFVCRVIRILEETGLAPELLELEITESTIIQNTEECLKNVRKLREIGVAVSIDDFGTGYSSLNYLRTIPFDNLKIDQSYVREMFKSKENMAILKTIITLARELRLKVIAEGVEDQKVLERLKKLGCDEIQGYFISRPLRKLDFEKLLRSKRHEGR